MRTSCVLLSVSKSKKVKMPEKAPWRKYTTANMAWNDADKASRHDKGNTEDNGHKGQNRHRLHKRQK